MILPETVAEFERQVPDVRKTFRRWHWVRFFEPGSCCFLSFLKAQYSILIRSRVFVFEFLSIHFDADAFLPVGGFFEGSNVVSRTLLQPFVAGNHDSSG